jgi:hypothetical protein
MKITASKRTVEAGRREDIIKQRDEWDAAHAQAEEQQKEEGRRFREAQGAVMGPIQQEIEQGMSKFDRLHTRVNVDTRWGGHNRGETIEVRIQVNEWEKFQDSVSLAWSMDIRVDPEDGSIVKETNSWSGLKATTADQLEDLRQTIAALEYLNSIDWATLLNKTLPNYEDFYKTRVPRDRPNFEQQLQELDLQELVGANKALLCQNWESSGFRGSQVWVQLIRETPSGYTGRVYWGAASEDQAREWLKRAQDNNYATQRIRKTTIKPVNPMTVIDIDEAPAE